MSWNTPLSYLAVFYCMLTKSPVWSQCDSVFVCHTIRWEFVTEEYDIAFGCYIRPDSAKGRSTEVVSAGQFTCGAGY